MEVLIGQAPETHQLLPMQGVLLAHAGLMRV